MLMIHEFRQEVLKAMQKRNSSISGINRLFLDAVYERTGGLTDEGVMEFAIQECELPEHKWAIEEKATQGDILHRVIFGNRK